jgi:hypothetical protein
MGFMKLNRFGDPSGCVFDAAAVVEKARQAFPGVQVLPGDPLVLSANVRPRWAPRIMWFGPCAGTSKILVLPAPLRLALRGQKRFRAAHAVTMSLSFLRIPWRRNGACACSRSCKVWEPDESKRRRALPKEPKPSGCDPSTTPVCAETVPRISIADTARRFSLIDSRPLWFRAASYG